MVAGSHVHATDHSAHLGAGDGVDAVVVVDAGGVNQHGRHPGSLPEFRKFPNSIVLLIW